MSKAIRYDSLLVRALAKALQRRYTGRGVRAIRITPDTRTLAIVSRRSSLLWNIDPDDGFLLERHERGRPAGLILPRGTITTAVRARPDDRALEWKFDAPAEGSRPGRSFHLWIELLPNRRTAVLAAEERVLASMGPVAGPGARFEAPSAVPRDGADAPLAFDDFAGVLRATEPAGRSRELLRRVAWTSPLNTAAILGDAATTAGEPALVAAWERYLAVVMPDDDGAVVLDPGGEDQPYPVALPGVRSAPHPDLLTAFEARSPAGAEPDRAFITGELERRLERLEKRVARLQAEAAGASADAGRLRHHAELLLSQPGLARRGMREVTVDDWAGGRIAIVLDPALDAVANARAMFGEARRRERAADRLPALIEAAQAELRHIVALRERVAAGEATESELDALRPAARPVGRPPVRPALPYRRYRTTAGSEIRVGRGARANDELTFHHSDPEDIWLHARHVGGAHVILRWSRRDENPPAAELTAAAVLAAVHSRARTSGVVAVDWTRRKHVRKPRGSPPGRVVIERAKTVFVEPDAEVVAGLRLD